MLIAGGGRMGVNPRICHPVGSEVHPEFMAGKRVIEQLDRPPRSYLAQAQSQPSIGSKDPQSVTGVTVEGPFTQLHSPT